MESRDFSEEIDLQKYWLVIKRRCLPALGIFGAVVSLAVLYGFSQEPAYRAEGKLLFKTNRTSALTGLGEDLGRLEALGYQNNPLDTQAEIVKSLSVLEATIQALNLTDEEGEPIKPQDLAEQLQVKGIPGTDVLTIAYESNDPEEAALVVNRIMEVYLKENVQSNRAEAASAREFIVSQLPKTEAAVLQADLNLRQFKEVNNVIVLEEEARSAVETISKLEDQIAQAQAQLADSTARVQQLQSRVGLVPQQAVALSALSQSTGVQDVLVQYQEVQRQLAVEQTRYREGHPAIDNLQRRIDALEALLQERVTQVLGSRQSVSFGDLQLGDVKRELITDLVQTEAERLGIAGRLNALQGAQAVYRSRASSLPRLEQTQRELERKLQAAQTTYEALLTRLQEIQVAENQNIGNARIVSPAIIPEDPVGPRKALILAAGGMAGLLLAIAAAFAIDLVDRSVKTVKEAKELFGYTVLGIIPALRSTDKAQLYQGQTDLSIPSVITRDIPRSPISEAYRMLQANLKFLNSDKPLKTIVVTSSIPKEGKSEVAANLATAIAQVGRRVLLVDADMRRPVQHHVWNLTNSIGLSNIIVDQIDIRKAVREVVPNLDVLSAGVIPPNPVALLDSRRMAVLVSDFAEQYDFVIFDTPPLSGTADAAVLGKMSDGMLLVVRPGVIDSTNAESAREFLVQSGQRVLGMVINGVDAKTEPDSYFYYVKEFDAASLNGGNTNAIEEAVEARR
ncbi:GumC family protein [Thermocoleostomius sinensis]|uniref:non-specific protein-tyrosine kinase n=1 Tax=Thermocoleostomius sinensis A174 TaxID=2016057 RepID=A0A9E8ZHB2_9CYAN|nr:polysaccharide biosynthesis tyrosine autokinase [Thermocoleostomius sinensis]WAL58526.1 polysaccharide biosynthesis tyrosine autokinase [Thermocoleostomius sinensis A174]